MTTKLVRILIVDDNRDMLTLAERELNDAFENDEELSIEVSLEASFDAGYNRVRNGECDLVILDVRRDGTPDSGENDRAGREVFERIQNVRFLPVIFWTALPEQVIDQKMEPLVYVFQKDCSDEIPPAVRSAVSSNVVEIMAGIENNVADIMRKHMWGELAPNWEEDTVGGNPLELARVLITRVASSLQDTDFPGLTSAPSHCYLYPPVAEKYRPGDLLVLRDGGSEEWWSIITPACDLEHQGKAEFCVLARANLLSGMDEYMNWAAGGSRKATEALDRVLSGAKARYHFLPAFRIIPDLVIDLEFVKSVPISTLEEYTRVASLISPYSEALLTRNSHFRGRIGTPDLDLTQVKSGLGNRSAEGN